MKGRQGGGEQKGQEREKSEEYEGRGEKRVV